jgi:hypothetical protein
MSDLKISVPDYMYIAKLNNIHRKYIIIKCKKESVKKLMHFFKFSKRSLSVFISVEIMF